MINTSKANFSNQISLSPRDKSERKMECFALFSKARARNEWNSIRDNENSYNAWNSFINFALACFQSGHFAPLFAAIYPSLLLLFPPPFFPFVIVQQVRKIMQANWTSENLDVVNTAICHFAAPALLLKLSPSNFQRFFWIYFEKEKKTLRFLSCVMNGNGR